MRNPSPSLKIGVLAALLTVAAINPAMGQQRTCESLLPPIPVVQGHIFPIDQTDVEVASARESGLQYISRKILGREARADLNVDEADTVKKLKTLVERRDFSTWFRFSDEVTRNLTKEAETLNALVKPIMTPQEGFLAKIALVRQAKYTIDVTYYIFNLDEAGLSLTNELRDAVRRGVNVRIMVDSLGSASASLKGNPHFRALLADAQKNAGYMTNPETGAKTNVRAKAEILVFNPVSNLPAWFRTKTIDILNGLRRSLSLDDKNFVPFPTTRWNPNRRSHDKLLIIDAQFPELAVGITGGRNIANQYHALDPADQENYRDVEVMVRNNPLVIPFMDRSRSVGQVLTDHFDRLYFHSANRNVSLGVLRLLFNNKKQQAKMDAATKKVEAVTAETAKDMGEDLADPNFGKKYLATGFMDSRVNIINSTYNLIRSFDNMQKDIKDAVTAAKYETILRDASSKAEQQNLMSAVVRLMAKETEEITVVTPYIWLSPKDVKFIFDWLAQDPARKFTLITNSILTSDNMPAQTLVDLETAVNLLSDPRFRDQIKIYEYGHADDASLGGTKHYGKLHFKGAYFKSLGTALVSTFNKDPRSQLENSEVAVVMESPLYSKHFEHKEVQNLIDNSHLYGSQEYRDIRSSPQLPKMKQEVIRHQVQILKWMHILNIWWLI